MAPAKPVHSNLIPDLVFQAPRVTELSNHGINVFADPPNSRLFTKFTDATSNKSFVNRATLLVKASLQEHGLHLTVSLRRVFEARRLPEPLNRVPVHELTFGRSSPESRVYQTPRIDIPKSARMEFKCPVQGLRRMRFDTKAKGLFRLHSKGLSPSSWKSLESYPRHLVTTFSPGFGNILFQSSLLRALGTNFTHSRNQK